ncbi:DNA gyrase subunit A [Caldithrix abyssi]|uniref:DNA gyrase subunit A n=1 Tax=Caldithrix abyssi DSM 13497 TaxID=880073 RepID=H1XV71_CALAY|nr:DNA gyrase subunit A [Caldithrix abyssi]APF16757.1 gyrA DNA gyrase subunit A [Caldithrix abyssi DSM 13497]EHO40577.1 DNA gyrase, A subunit [Caldithrix abyssi DSM 13497]
MASKEKIIPILIEDEMRESYLDYSMSVIVSRALPDVRDGLKPVHRRVLFGMHELGLQHNKAFKKSARIVGEVLGKYHPHGDMAVYDTLVRMVQDFSLRYPLIDGQGNFGSIDGDSPAAMRYTEVRLQRIAEELLTDINKNTVDFVRNFDETLEEPVVLPARLPNLLINGASGIAVGMATNIPPHNLGEVVAAIKAVIDNPEIEITEIMQYLKGPDFPTGGIIYGIEGIRQAYETGHGKILVRGKVEIEEMRGGREAIIIKEIPYQVNKLNLINKIVSLIKERKLEGISDMRDESDRDGMRIVIEVKKDFNPHVIINFLYKHTQLQTTFGINMLALVQGRPKVLNLKEMIQHFIDHRIEVIVRRTQYDLDEAERRAHILEGLRIAIDNIDEIIELIKSSANPDIAREKLIQRFGLTEIQAKAILDMRLQRLTGLEREKIENEYRELLKLIDELRSILASKAKQYEIIKEELDDLVKKYNDERRTEIVSSVEDVSIEDLILEEDVVITISHMGFVKRISLNEYRTQNRGGKGITGAVTKDEDFVEHLFIANTHDYILIFTDRGKCYWLKVYAIPAGSRISKGRPIINLIDIESGEKIKAVLPVKEFDDEHFILMATRKGLIKKTNLSAFSRPRKSGIIALNIREDDELIEAKLSDGDRKVLYVTAHGKAIHFHESQVRPMGRGATGVRAIRLREGDRVIAMVVANGEMDLLTISELGYGKRTPIKEFRQQSRGGSGIIGMKVTEKTGQLVGALGVYDNQDIVIITVKGIINRQNTINISRYGRSTQGVRLIRLTEGDRVSDVAKVSVEDEETQSDI